MTRQAVGEIVLPIPHADFQGDTDDSPASSQRDENHSAQGYEATLGNRSNQFINPERVASLRAHR
jgi:hypothetical protein